MTSNPYATSSFVGISLWLIPAEPERSVFQRLITQQAAKRNTIEFEPHATLLGGLNIERDEALAKTKELVAQLRQFPAGIDSVSSKNLYFQCVFGLLQPSEYLLEANEIARKVFDRQDDPPFMPHLSFVYGDLKDEEKADSIKEIEEEARVDFTIEKIAVWSTAGKVQDWHCIQEFPLRVE